MSISFIELLIGLSAGFLGGFLTNYFQQKGKNKALIEDNRKLTDEIEKVKSEYQLDLEKRKFKYESKKEQYFKYFNLIDDYHINSGKEMYDSFFPIVDRFNREYMSANSDKEKESLAVNNFSRDLNSLMFRANEDLIKIKNETNTIKLIANKKILKLLKEIETLYDKSFDQTEKMLHALNDHIIRGNPSQLEVIQERLTNLGSQIFDKREQLTEEVRKELDEI